jgi:oligopeptide/dipeptide ABC transporter ATP-binding protein
VTITGPPPPRSAAGAEATSVLEVKDLKTHYPVRRGLVGSCTRQPRQWVRAVDGVSFSLEPGEMLALVGESGSGKTSTAQTILRMVQAASGTIRFEGTDISRSSSRQMRPLRQRMQVIYQDPYESLDPRFRVRQTIEEPMLVHGIGGSRKARALLAVEVLKRVELSPAELYLDRYPHELSGGQRQRVAIAAALVLQPTLLIADEPVSMLDVSVRAGVLSLLDQLRREQNMAILMITHDLSTAAHFANRIAVMYLGQIVEQGPAGQVITNPQHPYTQALLSAVPQRDPLVRKRSQILKGETPNPIKVPAGCRFHPRCPMAEEQCRVVEPELRRPAKAGEDHVAACLLV